MNILLVNDKRYTEPFVKYLVKVVKQEVLANYNELEMAPFAEMLEKLEIKTTPRLVVQKAVEAITYEKIDNTKEKGFNIIIDDKKTFNGKYKIIDLVNLMDSGNTEMPPIPLFSNAFKDVEKDIDNYYRLYELGVGLFYEYLPL